MTDIEVVFGAIAVGMAAIVFLSLVADDITRRGVALQAKHRAWLKECSERPNSHPTEATAQGASGNGDAHGDEPG